jgi:hypothetical protein
MSYGFEKARLAGQGFGPEIKPAESTGALASEV